MSGPDHVRLSGDRVGEYVVAEEGADGTLTLIPDTSLAAIRARLGTEQATLEEFERMFGRRRRQVPRARPVRVLRFDGSDRSRSDLIDACRRTSVGGEPFEVETSIPAGTRVACALALGQGDGLCPSPGEILAQLRSEAGAVVDNASMPRRLMPAIR